MENISLKDIYIGEPDGKKEAAYRNDFEKFFVDIDENFNKFKMKEKYLVLGRKGSGKTFFGQYIKKISEEDPLHFCEIKSYSDFNFHEISESKTVNSLSNEYYEIWRWTILIDFAKLCMQDEKLIDNDERSRLKIFFEENASSIDIDKRKVTEITKSNSISGGVLSSLAKVSGESTSGQKSEKGRYLDYINDLEHVVITLISQSDSTYTVMYDDLDDRFDNTSCYHDSIKSLIKAADDLNLKIIGRNGNAKLMIFLRSDIFNMFNSPNLNKIKINNTIKIDWGDKATITSPLIKMIVIKIKNSNALMSLLDDKSVFYKLFPHSIDKTKPEKFILERTFFRPRDFISMLNLIIEKYPNDQFFGSKRLKEIGKDYSNYLLDEVKNEMYGHYEPEQINLIFKLIKNYNKSSFEHREIKEYMNENTYHYINLKLEEMLIALFKFNALGNKWFNKNFHKTYYAWAHRSEGSDLDLNKTILVHKGLYEAFLL